MKSNHRTLAGRMLHAAGIMISLATFILQALPVSWGIFLSASCFIVGSLFWPGWDGASGTDEDREARP